MCLGKAIKRNYEITEDAIDIGSYSRGTSTDQQPDVDLLFLGIPFDTERNFVDWTRIDTFSMVHTWDGITDVEVIKKLDPILFTAITDSLLQLEAVSSGSQFHAVRSWKDDPQVVFTISVNHKVCGTISIDVTLSYPKENFGAEHAKRFQAIVEKTAQAHGEARVLQLVEDIRRLKTAVKEEASSYGQIDRKKKVSGFLIEVLFMRRDELFTYSEVIAQLYKHEWPVDRQPELPERIQNQKEPLLGTNKSLNDLLSTVTKGGYSLLKLVAAREHERMTS